MKKKPATPAPDGAPPPPPAAPEIDLEPWTVTSVTKEVRPPGVPTSTEKRITSKLRYRGKPYMTLTGRLGLDTLTAIAQLYNQKRTEPVEHLKSYADSASFDAAAKRSNLDNRMMPFLEPDSV